MYQISFKPSFIRRIKSLDDKLCQEVFEKIELLKHKSNHRVLKVHKLHGRLSNYFSFSINYRIRAVFQFESQNEIALLDIGDHGIYK